MRFFCILIVPLALLGAARADELETIEGERVRGTLESISAAGKIEGPGLAADLNLASLRAVLREVEAAPAQAPIALETQGDGRLLANALVLSDDKVTASLPGGIQLQLPLDGLRSIRFEPAVELASFQAALTHPSADEDKIFVKVEKQIDTITGLVVALDERELTFEFNGEERKLPRERLHGIVLAQVAPTQKPPAMVHLTTGSRLAGKVVGLREGELTVELLGGANAVLPWNSVERIELRSPLVTYLSDLEPTRVREETVLTLPQPWRRDRSVSGKPLVLGDITYARGLGVHASSELVFDVPEGFDTFVALVGIDAATQRRGDCEVQVLGDDHSLWSQRIKGTDAAQTVNVDLRGSKQITLRVQAGADFDLADHLNWCNARLLKRAK
jgi:hypothetical protein